MTSKQAIKHVEETLISLLDSDVPSSQISRKADVTLSTITRLRRGDADLYNLSFANIIKLYESAELFKD